MDFIKRLIKTAPRLSEEDVKNIVECTFVKEIYSCWESNDYGDDFDLYMGLSLDQVSPRYFLKHFSRNWNGGWTYDETTIWYELSLQDYLELYQDNNP